MKDATSIAITFVICMFILLLYFLVGQSALNRNNAAKAAELTKLQKEESSIIQMGSAIQDFEERLPDLKKRINYYKLAVPSQIEDEIFFSHLSDELAKHNGELLELTQSGNRPWLGQFSKTDEEKYIAAGLDVGTIRLIKTSTFKIRLYGDFNDLLTVFENLKSLGRLYTIDQVISPAAGGAGTVLVDNSGQASQMEITGSLFYGIPEEYRDAAGLDQKYMEVAVVRNAQDISKAIEDSGNAVGSGDYRQSKQSMQKQSGGKDAKGKKDADKSAEDEDAGVIQSLLLPLNWAKGKG